MAQIVAAPYWLDVAMPSFGRLDRNLEVDSVVVGGGITGLTTAYLLKRAGRRVAVLERDRPRRSFRRLTQEDVAARAGEPAS